MNALKNQVRLIGNLGKDPEVITLENGNKLAKFTLATNEVYRNGSGEKVKETQWHQVVAWGKTADIAGSYLVKGSEVAISGKLVHRSYETAQGDKRYVTEVRCQDLLMLGKQA